MIVLQLGQLVLRGSKASVPDWGRHGRAACGGEVGLQGFTQAVQMELVGEHQSQAGQEMKPVSGRWVISYIKS